MIVDFEKSTAYGRVTAPSSKSLSHRYLICGALSSGSEIGNVLFSEDVTATVEALKNLGADVSVSQNSVRLSGLLKNPMSNSNIFCNESASTLRFLLPFCMNMGQTVTLSGKEGLMSRPMGAYEELCRCQGVKYEKTGNSIAVNGKLSGGRFTVPGDISSQFITGLMLALPTFPSDSVIDISGRLKSRPYVALTLKTLSDFGVKIARVDENTYYVKGNQNYKKRNVDIEGDYSNSAFLEAFNLFGGNVSVEGLSENSFQGDRIYKDIFPQLKKGCPTVDISDYPDLAPVLMAVAAGCNGAVFLGTKRLEYKESDRRMAMAEELSKFGCRVVIDGDKTEVKKCELKKPVLPLSSHNDHRVAMAVSVLCTLTGGTLYGAEAVNKSFPDFYSFLEKLGIKFKFRKPFV